MLRRHHFGYLQGSVWLSPDPTGKLRDMMGETPVDPEAFLIIEGRPAALLDPFLPRVLHPKGYPGVDAFGRRKKVFAGLAAES